MYELDYSQKNEKYLRLTVNYTYMKQLPTRRRRWANVTCSCGKNFDVVYHDLKNGTTKSCGCWKREKSHTINYKHGAARKGFITKEFRAWSSMIKRTTLLSHPAYKDYGGRGIIVCERWNSFDNFFNDMGNCPDKYSLDRIDNNGNYCGENCRWADMKTQSRNKRNNVFYEYRGNKYILPDLAKISGLNKNCLYHRLKSGMCMDDAMSTPSRKWRRKCQEA